MRCTSRIARSSALGLVVAATVACGSPPATTDAGSQQPSRATSASTTTTTVAVADCADSVLRDAVRTRHASAEVFHVVCESPYAVVTVRGGEGLAGDGVAFLAVKSGVWTVAASGPAADAATLAPADFSSTVVAQWVAARTVITTTTATRSATTTRPHPTTTPPTTTPGLPDVTPGSGDPAAATTTEQQVI